MNLCSLEASETAVDALVTVIPTEQLDLIGGGVMNNPLYKGQGGD